jgi:hypothetical protein
VHPSDSNTKPLHPQPSLTPSASLRMFCKLPLPYAVFCGSLWGCLSPHTWATHQVTWLQHHCSIASLEMDLPRWRLTISWSTSQKLTHKLFLHWRAVMLSQLK